MTVFTSNATVGRCQYRNAVASGQRWAPFTEAYRTSKVYPTPPRYGTDILQASFLTFEVKRG